MISNALSAVAALIASHPNFAYASVFLLALSESIPIIGVVVPGSAAIVAISALTPTGAVMLWPLLVAATAGAIVGDGLPFWVGHRYRRAILESWPVNRYPDLIARSQAFMARHGDKSIFLARFTPGVRAFIPLVAGMLGMSVRRFYAANVVSAIAWAPSNVLPGVIVGESLDLLGAAAKPLGILLVLLIILSWIILHAVRFMLRRGMGWPLAAMENLQAWAGARNSRLKRAVFFLLDPSRPDAGGLALLALMLVGAAWLFLAILENVASGDRLVDFDASIYHALQNLRTPPGDAAMIVFTELGDTAVVIVVTGVVFLWFAGKRAWRTAFYWLTAIAGASALNTAIKVALHRPRPGEQLYDGWSAFSFPSGHSTVNIVLYGFLAFLIGRELRPAGRLPIALGAALLVLLIAFSRLYLGAHWFSDVIGGLAFGSAWLAALGISYLRKPCKPIGPVGLIVVVSMALAVAGAANVARRHAFDIERYAAMTAMPSMPAADWWTGDWRMLPSYRVNLAGEREEPLTIQLAGELDALREILVRQGWRTPAPWTPLNSLAWLTATADPAELPVVPHLASGELPSLTLVLRAIPPPSDSRFVLRMWPVDLELINGSHAPVWVGSVVEERIDRPFSLISVARTQADANKPRDAIADAVPSGRVEIRPLGAATDGWDGRVLLIPESSLRRR
jgi:membrane protein DedA with SNARE-associated domain/membrane-associated phospholipid phosphatase